MQQQRLRGVLSEAAAVVAEQLTPSVVTVRAQRNGGGAGITWPGGWIITNHHVTPLDRAEVILADERRFLGRVVARDVVNDLAAIEIGVGPLPAATIGDARALRPGEIVPAA